MNRTETGEHEFAFLFFFALCAPAERKENECLVLSSLPAATGRAGAAGDSKLRSDRLRS